MASAKSSSLSDSLSSASCTFFLIPSRKWGSVADLGFFWAATKSALALSSAAAAILWASSAFSSACSSKSTSFCASLANFSAFILVSAFSAAFTASSVSCKRSSSALDVGSAFSDGQSPEHLYRRAVSPTTRAIASDSSSAASSSPSCGMLVPAVCTAFDVTPCFKKFKISFDCLRASASFPALGLSVLCLNLKEDAPNATVDVTPTETTTKQTHNHTLRTHSRIRELRTGNRPNLLDCASLKEYRAFFKTMVQCNVGKGQDFILFRGRAASRQSW